MEEYKDPSPEPEDSVPSDLPPAPPGDEELPPAPPEDVLIGSTIDSRYVVKERVARGGMATVYKADDRRLDRPVALKIMHPHLAESADFVVRFRREARAAARLTHPGIVAVYDQGVTQGTSYLVMEFVGGPNLRTHLRESGCLSVREALDLTAQVLEALASAHRAHLVHRDVKPENVLMPAEGPVKVADFGLARAVSEVTAATTGSVLGTVAYLAPEIVTSGIADARADVYAAGVMLYEMLLGHPPFYGDQPIQVAYRHVHEGVPAPSANAPWIPTEVDELVVALTARMPDERPVDANAALALVHKVRAALSDDALDAKGDTPATTIADQTVDSGKTSHLPPIPSSTTVNLSLGKDLATTKMELSPQDKTPVSLIDKFKSAPKKLWLLIALVTALVLASAGGIAWYFLSGPGSALPMVDVVGRTYDDALKRLEDADIPFDKVEEYHDTVAKGNVISTDPGPEGKLPKDRKARIIVSLGIEYVTVPDLRNQPNYAVQELLTTARLPMGEVTEEYSDLIGEGHVISQNPAPGDSVPHTTTVAVVLSKGREPVTMIDVTKKTREEAMKAIAALGLLVNPVEAFSEEIEQGTVISQGTPTGETLHKGDTVTITISKGSELAPIPNVRGRTAAQAKALLEEAGFVVSIENLNSWALGIAHSTSPSAGTMAKRGSTIVLNVA
ncbi:MAG: Stk1 family PASTA domain-containing Ser/Thr kinase [Actinomycetaceae bacterium]|nr:Stk1 family PASTA domain-containing Ser/Thr kinase [Actinomycetaceae bacterium]